MPNFLICNLSKKFLKKNNFILHKKSMEKVDQYLNQLGFSEFEKIKPLKTLSEKTGLKVSYIMAVFFTILLIFVLLEWGSFLITSLVGFIYPAYMSFKAIESTDSNDDTQWLTYWVVYSFFTVFNDIVIYFLGFIPFFYILKVALYVWMFHPRTKGAVLVYSKAIRPLLTKYEGKLDRFSNAAEENISLLADKGKDLADIGGNLAKKVAVDAAIGNLMGNTDNKQN